MIVCLLCLLPALPAVPANAHDFGGNSLHGDPPVTAGSGGQGGGGPAGPNAGNNSIGGNVYPCDGSEYFSATDVDLKGVFPIAVTRSYNSQSIYDSPLGYGWDYQYNARLYTYADNSVVIRWHAGFKQRFVESGGGFVGEGVSPGELADNGDGSFTYTGSRGMQWRFDVEGKLVRIIDIHGNSLRMMYHSGKKPLSGVTPFSLDPSTPQVVAYDYQLARVEEWYATGAFSGRYVDFDYHETTGRLVAITDFAGRTIAYQHDAKGNLVRVDFPEGVYFTYAYEDPHDIHNATAFGRGYGATEPVILYVNTYDDQDRVSTQQYGHGSTAFDYTIPTVRTIVTKTVRDENGDTLHQLNYIYEFDDMGHIVKFTDSQRNVFETTRDARGFPLREITWRNAGTVGTPSLVEERVVDQTRDAEGNLASMSVTLDSGEKITHAFTYDHGWLKSWSTTSTFEPGVVRQGDHQFAYNGAYPRQITRRRVLVDNGDVPQYDTVDFTYNDSGQLLTIDYPNGDSETYGYTGGFLTNANGLLLERDPLGNVTALTDPNNHRTRYDYDDLGRLVKFTNPLGEETVYRFTGFDLTEVESGIFEGNPGKKIEMAHDERGRVRSVHLDMDGSALLQKTYTYDSEDNPLSLTNASNQTWHYTYDVAGRLVAVEAPDESVFQYEYDLFNRPTGVTDPNGRTTVYGYDRLHRLVRVTDARGRVSRYGYNAVGNLVRVVDAENRTALYAYDLSGRLVRKEDAAGRRQDLAYDTKGRLVSLSGPDGRTVGYQYTGSNMLERITFSDDPSRVVSFGYDAGDNLTAYTDTDFSTSPMCSWTHDALNRVDTVTYPAIDKVLDYDYHRFGGKARLTCLSSGGELFSHAYQYDTAGRLSALTVMPQNDTILFTYDAEGRVTGKTFGNGSQVLAGFTAANDIDSLEFRKSDATVLESFQHTHDPMGNLTERTASQGATTFTYDPACQVTGADFPTASALTDESYTYDGNGNRLTGPAGQAWTYDAANQLQSSGTTVYAYDSRGNRISETAGGTTRNYSWDATGTLAGVTAPGLTAAYAYDHLRRRIRKTVNGTSTFFLYDGSEILAEFDETGDLIRHYAHQPGSGELLAIAGGSGVYPVMADLTGSPALVLDGAETPVWKSVFQVFGKAAIDDDPDADGVPFVCNHRFPGQYHDEESGLHYNIYRYYDSETGTYLQKDILGESFNHPLNRNPYLYTRNNPLAYVDPLGLKGKRQVRVITEEVMTNLLMSMAASLNGIKRHEWKKIFTRYGEFWNTAGDLDSWFRATQASVMPNRPSKLPPHQTLYTFAGDPKGRVYYGHELNYLLQGMLYEHLNLFWSIERPVVWLWKLQYKDGPYFTPTSQFWARRGRALYHRIMERYRRNPKWDYPKIEDMETVTLGEGNYHLEAERLDRINREEQRRMIERNMQRF